MSTVRGRIKNGAMEFDGPLPTDWPDGAEVETRLKSVESDLGWGMREEDWPTTPEGIEEWCAWVSSLEPFLSTPEELESFERVLAEQKAWELANWDARCKKIEGLFQ